MNKKLNHALVALLVFFGLASAFLWATGNLHIGPVAGTSAGGHGHAHASGGAEEDGCASGCGDCEETEGAGHSEPGAAAKGHDDCEGCQDAGHDEPHATTEGHDDCEDCADGHSAHADDEAILTARCEHDSLTIECDDCRYEVGAVKVNAALREALVETQAATMGSLSDELVLTGAVELDQTKVVEVAAAGKGRVIRIEKLLGQRVKKGDVLAVIQSADLGEAKAKYLEAQAKRQLAQTTFEREKALYEKKISSRADYLAAVSELQGAEAHYAAAEKRLNVFGMDSEQIAAIDKERQNGGFAQLVLRAPMDGTVMEQNITVGKLVETADSLYRIADLTNLWVWCDLYEQDMAEVYESFNAKGSLQAGLQVKAFEKAFGGTVDLITSNLDAETRTLRMRIQVPNEGRMLKPGMFASISIPVGETTDALMIPRTAVMTDGAESFVFEQFQNDYWLRRDVVTGRESNGQVEILRGLSENAQIVTKGAFMFKSDVLREKMGAGCAH